MEIDTRKEFYMAIRNITEIATDREYRQLMARAEELKKCSFVLANNFNRNNENMYERKRLEVLNLINTLQSKYDVIIHLSDRSVKVSEEKFRQKNPQHRIYYYIVDYVIIR